MSTQTVEATDTRNPRLRKGVEVTIPGQGRYRFMRWVTRDHDPVFNCWGPIDVNGNTPRGRVRSFRSSEVRTIHRKGRGR